MVDFQQKRKIRKAIYSKISLFALLIIIGLLIHATYGIYQKERLSATSYIAIKDDYDKLKAREDMLNSEIGRLGTDQGVEEDIRNKFSVAKPGEQIVVIVDAESTTSEGQGTTETFWQKLADFFK